jgi:carbon starvation protein CstA
MWTLVLSILALIVGYFSYGKIVERFFGANNSLQTPALAKADGVDYVVLPTWKVFTIQFLNIAGLGPIFGAVLGAMYGPMAYLWIVLGCIFTGAVHDYFSGMLSLRNDGASISEIVGKYLGTGVQNFLRLFTLMLLIFVGVAFVSGPADLLANLTSGGLQTWLLIIFAYYILATLLPINKVIGRIYPVFGVFLLIMAVGILSAMGWYSLSGSLSLSELSVSDFRNFHSNPTGNLLYPMMFIVISCGALSGFHATQAPMMARCLRKESDGRRVFYGAMIAEGIVTMIWATAAMNYFNDVQGLNHEIHTLRHNPAWIVNEISRSWLGKTGAVFAIVGVIVCPITTGDTAFRSARLTLADIFKFKQTTLWQRLLVSIPLFAIGFILSRIEFSTIWRYLGLSNQVLAVVVLWTAAAYLKQQGKAHWLVSLPATFMSSVCITYLMVAPITGGGLAFSTGFGYSVGIIGGLMILLLFLFKSRVLLFFSQLRK